VALPSTIAGPAHGSSHAKARQGAASGRGRGPLAAAAFIVLTVGALAVAAFHIVEQRALIEPALPFLRRVLLLGASLVSFLGWGRALLRQVLGPGSAALSPEERCVFEIGAGAWITMLFVLGAGTLGCLSPAAAWTFLSLPLLWLLLPLVRRDARDGSRTEIRVDLFVLGLVLVGAMTFAASQTPAISQDALVYHLAAPQRFLEDGAIRYIPGNFYTAFPFNMEMLFTLGLLLDGEELAKSYHWLCWIGSVAAVALLSTRLAGRSGLGFQRLGSGACAGAIFGTIPTAALIAGWAYVDLAVVFYTTMSVLALVLAHEAREGRSEGRIVTAPDTDATALSDRRALILASIFAGAAAGTKYTAGLQGLLLLAFVIVRGARRGEPLPRIIASLAIVSLVVGIGVGPWLLKNTIENGNPFFPFAFGIFGGKDWDSHRAAVLALSLAEWGGTREGLEWLRLPWDVTVGGRFFSIERFDGVIGWAFLGAFPWIVLGAASRVGRRVAFFTIAYALAWVMTTHQVRFLLPALALAAALLGAGVARFPEGLARTTVRAVLAIAVFSNVLLVAIHFAAHRPLGVVLGQESRESFLEREVPGGDWAVFEHIAKQLPPDARVFFASCGSPGFLCKRDYYADAYFENFMLERFLEESDGPDELRATFAREGFTHVLFRGANVFDPSERRSGIPFEEQLELAELLNRYGTLEIERRGTLLYRLEREPR